MYDSIRIEFHWLRMANDVYITVINSSACARNGRRQSLKSKIQLFPANGPFEVVAIDMLGPLPRSMEGNQYDIVIIH